MLTNKNIQKITTNKLGGSDLFVSKHRFNIRYTPY